MAAVRYDLTGDASDLTEALGKALKALDRVEDQGKKTAKAVDKVSSKAAASSSKINKGKVAFESLKAASEGVGGALGENVGKLEKFGQAAGGLASLLGPVGMGIAAVTAAVGAMALGMAAAGAAVLGVVLATDELQKELEPLQDIPGFQPIDPGAQAAIETVNGAMAALRKIMQQVVVTLGANFAPALEEVALLAVKFGLAGLDAFQAWQDGKSVLREIAIWLTQSFIEAIWAPITGIMQMVEALGKVGEMLGLEGNALQKAAKAYDDFTRSIGEAAVDNVIGAAGEAVGFLSMQTGDLDERARALISTVREQTEAHQEQTKAVKEQAKAEQEAAEVSKASEEDKTAALEKEMARRQAIIDAHLAEVQAAQTRAAEEEQARQVEIREAAAGAAMDIAGAVEQLAQRRADAARDGSEAEKRAALTSFRVSQAAALVQIAIDTAVAVTKALAQLGPVAGGFAAAGITATGATQAALVAGQSPPEFPFGGMISPEVLRGSIGSQDHGQVSVEPGEGILNRGAVARAGGPAGVEALNRGSAGGQAPLIVQQVYRHRVFDSFVRDNLTKGGPLKSALNAAGGRPGHTRRRN